jgi:hypothetical protein
LSVLFPLRLTAGGWRLGVWRFIFAYGIFLIIIVFAGRALVIPMRTPFIVLHALPRLSRWVEELFLRVSCNALTLFYGLTATVPDAPRAQVQPVPARVGTRIVATAMVTMITARPCARRHQT